MWVCFMGDFVEVNNIIHLKDRIKGKKKDNIKDTSAPVALSMKAVCAVAGNIMKSGVVIGQSADGSVKLMTTMEDTAEIICYLESAKHALLSNGLTED